jgi:hypothetical protein
LLIGRNFRVGDYRAQEFHHLESPKGQEILNRLIKTLKQRREEDAENQRNLEFEFIPELQRVSTTSDFSGVQDGASSDLRK